VKMLERMRELESEKLRSQKEIEEERRKLE
jgi:hypothetical protein